MSVPGRLSCAGVIMTFFLAANGEGCFSNRGNGSGDASQAAHEERFQKMRERMVRDQLQGRDIKDSRVLDAMLRVPRHRFVPGDLADSAYTDNALPLMLGQTISQPYIVAYMTQALNLEGNERILEIGTGSGYQAAILAELAAQVYSVEILPELAERARRLLEREGYRNVRIRAGDGYEGWPEFAPFDRIIVTAAPDHVPQALVDQLRPEGTMIIPVGRVDQELVLIRKGKSGISSKKTIPVRFVPMTGKARERPPD